MAEVFIKFPKTGLGNMMLVWARGMVFAKLNGLPYHCSSWWGLRWGALLRKEKKKRLYWGYFNETSLFDQVRMKIKSSSSSIEIEPKVEKRNEISGNKTFVFNKVITNNDLFGEIRGHKDLVATELNKILTPKIKFQLENSAVPEIAIHIRRGDFKMGNAITPLTYFIDGIKFIRNKTGKELRVTVFTDAAESEISDVLKLNNVVLSENNADIVDILLMSKAQYIILSQSSTFSYWAAFLSGATVIRPKTDWQERIKTNEGNYLELKV